MLPNDWKTTDNVVMDTAVKINQMLVSSTERIKMQIVFVLLIVCFANGKAYEIFDYFQPSNCNSTSYFDILSHTCRDCGPSRISSADRLTCQCQKGFFSKFNQLRRTDECLQCDSVAAEEICTIANLTCGIHDIKVLQMQGNRTVGRCLKCPFWTQPNADQLSCVPCNSLCRCPDGYEDLSGTCVKNGDVLNVPDVQSLYTFQYKGKYHVSGYFRDRAKHIANKCKATGYSTFCEQLANLCALIDYNFDSITVCSLYRQLGSSLTLPSIYYDEGRNFELLDVERIPLAGGEELQFVVKQYGLDGTYKGVRPLTSIFSSKCCAGRWRTRTKMNANTRESCRLSPKDLMADRMHFYELFLVYAPPSHAHSNGTKLINVPLRVLNFVRAGFQRNKDGDIHRWQLTKRFFNVDLITGQNQDTTAIPDGTVATGLIRYLSTLEIRVSLVPSEGSPQLRVPYATIEYQVLDNDQEKATIDFLIEYAVNMDGAIKSIEIALSVLSSLAAVYSVFRTWVWYRRSAKVTVELVTLIRFLIFAADILSNVIFLVIFLSTFYWLITFRQQHEITVTLPKEGDEQFIKDLVISAFALKAASVLAMIGYQCNVNVFMIDWENPRPSKTDAPVSAWRMYFVANEWNEIQVIRKSYVSLQIVLVLLTLKVLNFEIFALELPTSGFHTEEHSLRYNCLLRFALGVTTYLSIASLQILFNWLVYESYVENKIQQLIDLCTLSNISLWLLVQERYGFYIHGRSPHGFSDTDMQTMCQQLQKEEDNMCAQRGLVQGQDCQTFTLSLHSNLIEAWSRLLVPSNSAVINATSLSTSTSSKSTYDALNKFLASFLDHALREVDYEVRDRYFLEKVFNFEIYQPLDRTVFYNDGNFAFDNVLFYGNEVTLLTFDVLLFSLVDIYCHNYVAAGITTFLIFKFLQFFRQRLGRRNLAKKTLIDSRFLF